MLKNQKANTKLSIAVICLALLLGTATFIGIYSQFPLTNLIPPTTGDTVGVVGPMGPIGPIGPAGPTGATGPAGPAGADGADAKQPLGAYSYLIYVSDSEGKPNATGGYYSAQDGLTGDISWTSTNVSSIIQSAINSMISKGGLIHIDSGNYTITNTIFLYSGITIEGSGNGVSTPTPNTVLTLANGANCDMFWFTNTTSHDFFETIRHITLIGNKAQQTADSNGIVVRGAVSDTTIDDVFFWEFRNASVYFEGEASGKQYYQFIQNSWIEGAGQYGIRMGTNSSLLAHHINIFNNHAITLNDVGIYMQYASYAQISLNTIKDNNKQGIYCQSSPYSHIENNFIFGNGVTPTNTNPDLEVNSANNVIVLGNSLGKTGYTSPKYALYLYWSDNVTVIGNDMWTGGTSIIGFSGSSGVVEKNARYNPVGYIINPFTGITLNLLNSGNNATMTSDWIYTNQFTTKTIYVSGGTVTAIKVNGQATGLTTGSFVLYPFDTFSITFSSAPTLKVMCQ
jgi:parallel beta-helix repeat protein